MEQKIILLSQKRVCRRKPDGKSGDTRYDDLDAR